MSLLERIPAKVRFCLYLAYVLAGPVLIYTASKGWTGTDEYTLYAGVGTALGLTAAANVRTRQRIPAGIKVAAKVQPEDVVIVADKPFPPTEPTGYGSGV